MNSLDASQIFTVIISIATAFNAKFAFSSRKYKAESIEYSDGVMCYFPMKPKKLNYAGIVHLLGAT